MNKILIIFLILFIATNAYALRLNTPPTLSTPTTEEETSQLNRFLNDSWLIQNGRFELDVVTTPKTNAKNGEIWIILTGSVAKIQFKANGIIWTTP